ncbi:MAG: LexA family transcriptional regulator [Methylobacter sp.]|jgi:SOS-response transcriptional repressor LexA
MGKNNNTFPYYRQCANVFVETNTFAHTYKMSTLQEILEEEMTRQRLNDYDLEAKSKVPQPTIQRIRRGKHSDPRSSTVKKLAFGLGLTEAQLRGIEPRIGQVNDEKQKYAQNNLSLSGRPDNYQKLEMIVIPLLAFDRAGEWQSALKTHHPEDGEIMTKPITGKDLFAVAVPDDAMRTEFWEDENIVIDPHMEPKHKSFVLVSMGDVVIFRQLWNDAGEWLLKPLNERYDNRPLADNRVIGVVRRKVKETDYR